MDEIFCEPGTTGFEAITVRELRADDLDAIVRIDAGTSGNRRPEYYQRKLAGVGKRNLPAGRPL